MYVEVEAQRDGRFWVGRATNVKGAFVQVRRLSQAEAAMREVLAMLFDDEDVSEWHIEVTPRVTGRPRRLVDAARWLRESSTEADRLTQYAASAAAHHLASEGVSQRDIGQLLGLSFQRVSQLMAQYPEAMTIEQLRGYVNALEMGLTGVRQALTPEERETPVRT